MEYSSDSMNDALAFLREEGVDDGFDDDSQPIEFINPVEHNQPYNNQCMYTHYCKYNIY